MKRAIIGILLLTLVFALVGCGSEVVKEVEVIKEADPLKELARVEVGMTREQVEGIVNKKHFMSNYSYRAFTLTGVEVINGEISYSYTKKGSVHDPYDIEFFFSVETDVDPWVIVYKALMSWDDPDWTADNDPVYIVGTVPFAKAKKTVNSFVNEWGKGWQLRD